LILLTGVSGKGFFCDQEKSTAMFLTFPGMRRRRKMTYKIAAKKAGSDIATASPLNGGEE